MTQNQSNTPIPPGAYSAPADQGAPQRPVSHPVSASSSADVPSEGAAQAGGPGNQKKPKIPKGASMKGAGLLKVFAAGFLGALLACLIAFNFPGFFGFSGDGQTVIGGEGSLVDIDEDADRAEAVAQKALPSVAAIDVYSSDGGRSGLLSPSSETLVYTGLGSGVVISEDGYIVTNNHVVEGASVLKVTVDGQEYEGEVVGTDPVTDLAVVKVDAKGLTAIELGDSDDLAPGQWVMALGSPFGLEQSVSTGIVSATSRTITVQGSQNGYGESAPASVYSQMIQTDAAINPGNSGGALVDEHGRLIGINAVIESASGNYAGVGFAIPVNYAISIATQIIDGQVPTHASLGVSCITVSSDIAARYGFHADEGAYISAVMPDSAAYQAGLEEGDIVTAVGDQEVASSTDLVAAIRKYQIGDTVELKYVRGDKEEKTKVKLGSDGVE